MLYSAGISKPYKVNVKLMILTLDIANSCNGLAKSASNAYKPGHPFSDAGEAVQKANDSAIEAS